MSLSVRSILRVLLVVSAYLALILLAWTVRRELVWIGIAFFLSVALSPAVRRIPTRRRVTSVLLVFFVAVVIIALVGVAIIPPLVNQSQSLAKNVSQFAQDLQKNKRVAELLDRYKVLDRVRGQQSQILSALSKAGLSVASVAKGVFSSVAALITILGLTVFMLLEGPTWWSLFLGTQPEERRRRIEGLADQMYRAVTGYVTGNLLTSVVAAVAAAVVLLIVGVPYVVPLAVIVALLDLLPLVGATLAAIIVIIVAFFHSWVAAVVMLVFFIVYQQFENHVLQPLVYGRTVEMSPLLVLISVLIGAGLAGLVGALVAIPIAASIQIVIRDMYARSELSGAKGSGLLVVSRASPPARPHLPHWRRRGSGDHEPPSSEETPETDDTAEAPPDGGEET
jgi:predicted PurR-regulated permease PerM